MTPIGLGLAALGRPGYVNLGHGADLGPDHGVEAMRRRCHEVLDAAWAGGIRYLDAARSYGRAEEFLASWLEARRLSRAEVTVGSKWGYTYTAGWRVEAPRHEVKDHSVATFLRQLGESRALLGASLALYQIHSATLETGVLDDREVLDALARSRDEGIAIGLTLTGPDQAVVLARAMAAEVGGTPVFDTVQATWNLLEPSAGAALAEAHAAGMGVIVKEALANGRLAAGNPRLPSPLAAAAAESGAAPDGVALAAALAQPWADVVLSGAVTVAQLRANLDGLRVRLSPDAVANLTGLAEEPDAYWAARRALPWN